MSAVYTTDAEAPELLASERSVIAMLRSANLFTCLIDGNDIRRRVALATMELRGTR
jgi:hypothetical protein